MMLICRPFADSGAVGQPEANFFGLFVGHLLPFLSPEGFDGFAIHHLPFLM